MNASNRPDLRAALTSLLSGQDGCSGSCVATAPALTSPDVHPAKTKAAGQGSRANRDTDTTTQVSPTLCLRERESGSRVWLGEESRFTSCTYTALDPTLRTTVIGHRGSPTNGRAGSTTCSRCRTTASPCARRASTDCSRSGSPCLAVANSRRAYGVAPLTARTTDMPPPTASNQSALVAGHLARAGNELDRRELIQRRQNAGEESVKGRARG